MLALAVAWIAAASEGNAADSQVVWANATSSPVALDPRPLDPLAREALSRCGTGEGGLLAAARQVAARKAHGLPMPDAEAIAAAQRAEGEPHPWARAWAAS